MTGYADYLRWLYRDGHPNLFARVQNRVSAVTFSAGIWPRRVATLEVRGRRSGRSISFPVVIAEFGGERYLVAMLGERSDWPRNVRAAGGRAFLRHGRREAVTLVEIDPVARARSCVSMWLSRQGVALISLSIVTPTSTSSSESPPTSRCSASSAPQTSARSPTPHDRGRPRRPVLRHVSSRLAAPPSQIPETGRARRRDLRGRCPALPLSDHPASSIGLEKGSSPSSPPTGGGHEPSPPPLRPTDRVPIVGVGDCEQPSGWWLDAGSDRVSLMPCASSRHHGGGDLGGRGLVRLSRHDDRLL